MRKYLPPPHKFRSKTLDSTDTVDFTHFRRTVNRYCEDKPVNYTLNQSVWIVMPTPRTLLDGGHSYLTQYLPVVCVCVCR